MAHNASRFVIIDGVQISRQRAEREGLIDKAGRIVPAGSSPSSAGPSQTRARSASSTRATTAEADVAPSDAPKKRGAGTTSKKPKATDPTLAS